MRVVFSIGIPRLLYPHSEFGVCQRFSVLFTSNSANGLPNPNASISGIPPLQVDSSTDLWAVAQIRAHDRRTLTNRTLPIPRTKMGAFGKVSARLTQKKLSAHNRASNDMQCRSKNNGPRKQESKQARTSALQRLGERLPEQVRIITAANATLV